MRARVLAILATLAILVTLASGCVRSESVRCGDEICPRGTTRCITVSESFTACASGDQVEACEGKQEAESCELPAQPVGYCHGGACLPPTCGDAVVDAPTELCDLASVVPPAQCSEDCRTDFRCGNGLLDSGEVCDDLNPFSHDGCASQCVPESPRWTELEPGAPKLLVGHAMAFDGIRGSVLLFGGISDGQVSGDTFEWDGLTWLELATPNAPQPRSEHAMAYDAARGRVVLFGGLLAGASFESSDTWEWDGTRWRLIYTPTAPPGRRNHAMVYDARRERVILFGGLSRTVPAPYALSDTWEWDGIAWTQIGTSGPPARAGHAMAYDAAAGVTIAFGGTDGIKRLGDTWQLDGTTWMPRTPAKSPVVQEGATMAFDGVRTVLVGGTGDLGDVREVWVWDGQTWEVEDSIEVRGAQAAFDPRRNRVVVFGESTIGIILHAITFEWDPLALALSSLVTGTLPGLESAAATSANRRGRSWLFGGCTQRTSACSVMSSDTYALVGNGWTQLTGEVAMSGRTHAAIAYHEVRQRLVLFGGRDSAVRADTWVGEEVDDNGGVGISWVELPSAGLAARHMHAMVYDDARHEVLLFGGNASADAAAAPLQDTWTWDGTWTQRSPAQAPPPRFGHAIGYDLARERVVVFGGTTDDRDDLLGDTWEWDGATWTRIDVPGPTARRHARMAWNPVRRRLVLVGGEATPDVRFNDVWEWDGTTWTELYPPASPPAHGHHVLVTTTDGSGVLMQGGRSGPLGLSEETWRLRWESATGLDDRCRDDSDNDGDGLVGCADSDCWMACTPYCSPGLACDPNAGPRCGDDLPQPWESCGICPGDFGGPCPPICGDFVCEPPEDAASCRGDCPP